MRSERRRRLAYEIQRLRSKGRSKRTIARELGVSRKTIRVILNHLRSRSESGETAPERELKPPRTPKASKLDSYEAQMREWLEKHPNLKATRCLEMLQDVGFKGGYTIVLQRLRELRQEIAPPPPAVHYETAPGQRVEFDWSPYELSSGLKVQLWNATLRWSRAASLAAATDVRQPTTLELLRRSFEEWEGVPQECLTDSMPGLVDRWECGQPILNVRYVDFASYYGYTALIAPRGCPKWKAIAERLFRYHEENLLNGRTLVDLAQYEATLEWWRRERKMQRPHPETRRPIREMLELERPHLHPLPAHAYDTRDVVPRVVDSYQRVHFQTNHYPVPALVGDVVYVCADRNRVEICDRHARRLIEHERLKDGAGIQLEQLPAARKRGDRYDIDELVARLAEWSEDAAEYANGVRESRRSAGAELVRVLSLQITWSRDDIVEAMRHAMAYHCFESSKLERILEARSSPRSLSEQISESGRRQIQSVKDTHPIVHRPLSDYQNLREGDHSRIEEDDRNAS